MNRRLLVPLLLVLVPNSGGAQDLPAVQVEPQPFLAATERLLEALDYLGAPLPEAEREAITKASHTHGIQAILDRHVLCAVNINPESRVKVAAGPAGRELVQGGWRTFLVKVHNEAGITAELKAVSEQALPVYGVSWNPELEATTESDVAGRFLDLALATRPPMSPRLSGLELEYYVLQLYSRDAGKREATLTFHVGQGTQDLGFRSELPLLFDCVPAVDVRFELIDHDGEPTTAALVVRDPLGRVHPSPGRRLAPDFFFHDQVYRRSGESIPLAPGSYTVEVRRGPEYETLVRDVVVPAGKEHVERFELKRWIHLAAEGWRSGDHHVHAAGCAHYDSPTQGVTPADMMRHIEGEDLNVGCVLSWGPCWYYQKEFFEGGLHALSSPDHLMRYDVEVSGFPSSHAGHLSLLGLLEDDYPGTKRIEDWPSWDLPVLQWAKSQGAVAGFSHSGFGLQVSGRTLPSYEVPPFDNIGANEYIVDVVHDAVDFISAVDTPSVWELNIWYHTLNCGYRTRISGETDFPCIYGERVGIGRSYVKTGAAPFTFDNWLVGLKDGRSYVTDGMSHLLDFTVGGVAVGEPGPGGVISQLELDGPTKVGVTARVAALLNETPDPGLRDRRLDQGPYWHLERARIGDTRRVAVELIVNGQPVARKEITADGSVVSVQFEATLERSSWVALRIFPSSHTNPVFVHVGDKPIRASRRSASWCRQAVDNCWSQKRGLIRDDELDAAREAYDVARATYDRIATECEQD